MATAKKTEGLRSARRPVLAPRRHGTGFSIATKRVPGPAARVVRLTAAASPSPGGLESSTTRRRRFDAVVAHSAASSPVVRAAVGTMDPTPTPWYKREFDIHLWLDKGLGSVMLILATFISLGLANSAMSGSFVGFWEHFHFGPASIGLHLNAHEWVNEGLMALFFFNVGLEIKREFAVGSLSNMRAALLPCFGALGGMVAPMGVYLALQMAPGGVAAGWAIPMATDIAFAMGVYNFFKTRMPPAVAAFLLTLATVDDLGAIAVIAVFFAKGIVPGYLVASAGICVALFVACKKKVAHTGVYAVLGCALWFALLKGGINADIAGVVAAVAIPASAPAPAGSHAHAHEPGAQVSLLDHLIHNFHPWSSLLIMPLFALANCAVPVNGAAMGTVMTTPVGLGVMAGLLLGKPLGIVGLCYAAVKTGVCAFPTDMNVKHLATVGVLAGIGFTMSLFLIEQSLFGASAVTAKLAILCSSAIAAIAGGYLMTRFPIYMCEVVCDEDACRPEDMGDQVFKSMNSCDEDGCEPSFEQEAISAVTGEKEKRD